MDSKETLLLKLAEETRNSILNNDMNRCRKKLEELKIHLDNLNLDNQKEEIDYYIGRLEDTDNAGNIQKEISDFTDSLIGKYIGKNISDFTPADIIIIEDSDINMTELLERGGPTFVGKNEDLLNNDRDQIIQDHIISRFDLDMNIEDINNDLKTLLSYLSLELIYILEYANDNLSNVASELSNKADERQEQLNKLDRSIQEATENLEEIADSESIREMPEPSPEVRQELEKTDDN